MKAAEAGAPRAHIAWSDLTGVALVGGALLLGAALGAPRLAQSAAERFAPRLAQFTHTCAAARPPDTARALACLLAARSGR